MSDTLPDALASDLRTYWLSAPPTGTEAILGTAVRLKNELEKLPVPRLVILYQDPKRFPSMPGTARVPLSMDLITSLDATSPEAHKALAGLVNVWWQSIRNHRGQNPGIFEKTFIHDWLVLPPMEGTRNEDREQVTTFRVEAIATLPEASLI